MDILKTSLEWAKAEVFSAVFFIIFGGLFVLATVGFWQLGKTELAKAFVYPTLVAGILLLIIGIGLFLNNKYREHTFPEVYQKDPVAFVDTEIARAERTLNEYQTVVFKAIPIIIVIAALCLLFIDKPMVRAISMTTIAMMIVILLVDTNAHARIDSYYQKLLEIKK